MAQTEAVNQNARGVNTSAFDSEDLSFLQVIIDELLVGMVEGGDCTVQGNSREALKRDLAKAVFACAHPGERDAASLKRQVMRSRPKA